MFRNGPPGWKIKSSKKIYSHPLITLFEDTLENLKCFNDTEPRQEGPYKFSQQEIRDLFSKYFRIESIKETVYQGTLDPLPKALFAVMIKKL